MTLIPLGSPRLAAKMEQNWWRLISDAQEQFARGQTDSGLATYKSALGIARGFSSLDPRYSETLRMIASVYIGLGRIDAAVPYLTDELNALSQMGDQFPDLDYDYFYLGIANARKGDYERAAKFFQKALPICNRYARETRPDTALVSAYLSATLFVQDKDDAAALMARRAARYVMGRKGDRFKIRNAAASVRFDVFKTRNRYLKVNGRLDTAFNKMLDQFYIELLALGKKRYGENSSVYLDLLGESCQNKISSGHLNEAMDLNQIALAILEKQSPKNDYEIGKAKLLLAQLCLMSGKLYLARKWYSEALRIMNNSSADRESDTHYLEAVNRLVDINGMIGMPEQSFELLDAAMSRLGPSKFEPLSVKLALLCDWKANRLFCDGKPEAALAYHLRARDFFGRQKQYESEYLRTVFNLGICYQALNRMSEAQAALEEVVNRANDSRVYVRQFTARRAGLHLSKIYRSRGMIEEAERVKRTTETEKIFEGAVKRKLARIKSATPERAFDLHKELGQIYTLHAATLRDEGKLAQSSIEYRLGLSQFDRAGARGLEFFEHELQFVRVQISLGDLKTARSYLEDCICAMRSDQASEKVRLLGEATSLLKTVYSRLGRTAQAGRLLPSRFYEVGRNFSQGVALVNQGLFDLAQEKLRKVIVDDSSIFGSESSALLRTYQRLIDCDTRAFDFEKTVHDSLVYEELERLHSVRYVPSHNSLATAYLKLGRPEEAEKIYRRTIANPHWPKSVADTVTTYYGLGLAMILQGKTKEGYELIGRARKESARGSALDTVGSELVLMTSALRKTHVKDEERLCLEEMQLQQRVSLKSPTVGYALMQTELGDINCVLGRVGEGEKLYKNALSTLERQSEVEDSSQLRLLSLTKCERVLRSQGREEEADRMRAEIVRLEARSGRLKGRIKQ